jgi:DNA primase large subunit
MISLGQDEIAKYPFLAEAGQYLNDKGFTLEQFATDPDLKIIVDKAYERIESAAEGKIYNPKTDNSSDKDIILPLNVFSFLIAIVLLKLSGLNTLINRFSLAEARRAEKFLERDLVSDSNKTSEEFATKIFRDIFSITIKKAGDYFVISISDYLQHAVNFHELEWKLVNRHVENGMVFLTPHESARLIRKELSGYIGTKIRAANTPPMSKGFEDKVHKLSNLAKKFVVNTVVSTEIPPCIEHAIEALNKGENLSHSGRFMLATFLLGRGQTIDEIAPLFKNAPDYNEKITRYQIKQVAGEIGGNRTKYVCPSCEKIKSNDLCFATPDCDNIINPMQFGKKRL